MSAMKAICFGLSLAIGLYFGVLVIIRAAISKEDVGPVQLIPFSLSWATVITLLLTN